MRIVKDILDQKAKITVVGLGYVGMPLAVAFARTTKVIGFDVDKKKIEMYCQGLDPTKQVGDKAIKETSVEFTSDNSKLKESKFIIVAVPTPIKIDKTPNLEAVINACRIIGQNTSKGAVIVFESTVYPGLTEDVCIPILEKESGLICGKDFKVGYSPERINPGDKENRLENIKKIVAGMDNETLDIIAKVYEIIIEVGVHRVSSIKVAEAAKVAENSQRDINIAFMNELSMVFDRML
ncbi:nucleotide sugar dehydrogenase [Natranaerovirga pectinivora]|uniref:Nucleotide sugar dehydrogenase n=1 Tax=Natranaerovirga pectinivora TaxID=682400 RepID=A0A4R3MM74_9FIRM|nr:nucleotide sugar dehydrogenase [Natranaerovirga pectinivora]